MTNKYIDYIIACEAKRLESHKNPFVGSGSMGMCLFLFNLYEHTSNESYLNLARHFLLRACLSIKKRSKMNFLDGLSGIGLSILYLYKKGYVEGDMYSILRNIDDEIYRNVIQLLDYNTDFILKGHEEALMDVALYVLYRIKLCEVPFSEEKILKLFIAKIVNLLYQSHDYLLYIEPIPYNLSYHLPRFIYLLSNAHHLDICRDRVANMWEEIRRMVLAQFPYFDSNKVLLLFSFCELQREYPHDRKLHDSIENLKKNISIYRIVNDEFPANSMYMNSGLPGLIGLLLNSGFLLTKSDMDLLINKIEHSCFFNVNYEELLKKNFVGLNGILGFIIIYLLIKRRYE